MSSRAAASMRSAVALYRRALAGLLPAKLAGMAAWAVAAITAAIAVSIDDAPLALDAIEQGLGWIVWLGAGPLAWMLARRHPESEGLAAMVALAGAGRIRSGGHVHAAEWRAAFAEMMARVLLPGALVFAVAALAMEPLLLLGGLLVVIVSAAAAAMLTITALACRAAARRGRTLFVAVVLLPWALADVLGVPQLSVPGALSALLAELTDMLSLWVTP